MKLPNNYGGVIRLGGRRRKKYAVRISCGYRQRICIQNKAAYFPVIEKYKMAYRKDKNDYAMYCDDESVLEHLREIDCAYKVEFVRKFKYLAYFERSKEAYEYLAKYNSGYSIKEHVSIASQPSFKVVYEQYVDFLASLKKKPSKTTLDSYRSGFNLWEDVHDLRFRSITTQQLQDALLDKGELSRSSIQRMKTILRKMYKYAVAHDICSKEDDKSDYLTAQYAENEESIHRPFTDEEIKILWDSADNDAASMMLILIYSGMRCGEFLSMKKDNVYLDKRYMIGGSKTQSGRNRRIPIHERIVPLVDKWMTNHYGDYLYPLNGNGNMETACHVLDSVWKPFMEKVGMEHLTHDCRYTCATKMEKAGIDLFHRKLILGHKIDDITLKTYTKVPVEDLIKDINKIS